MLMFLGVCIPPSPSVNLFSTGPALTGCLESITSVQQTKDGNAVLVSTLDSTIRLLDKGNGQMLQCYQGHKNSEYRIRSCLGMADSVVISGSEDGKLYAWDLLEGKVIGKMEAHEGKVASAVTCNSVRNEWASAGVDGKFSDCIEPGVREMLINCRHCRSLGDADMKARSW